MNKQLPSVRDLVAAAREAKHDSLGIGSDPEALIHLANVSRRAFLEQKDLLAFRDWSTTVEDIARLGSNEPEIRDWLLIETVRLDKGRQLLQELLEDERAALVALLGTQAMSLDEAERQEVAATLEVAWRTSALKAAEGGA